MRTILIKEQKKSEISTSISKNSGGYTLRGWNTGDQHMCKMSL